MSRYTFFRGRGRLILAGLVLLLLAAVRPNFAGAYDCTGTTYSVASESDLNAAIGCFNAATGTASYVIVLTENLALTASTVAIDNSSGPDLLIRGGYHTVSGQYADGVRPFTIGPGTPVSMYAVNVAMGDAETGGGIANQGTLTLRLCMVTNNYAKKGGSIFNSGTLILDNSAVLNSHVTESGGAVFNDDGATLTVLGGNFFSNTAPYGGAFYTAATATVVVDGAHVFQNSAETEGGAFYGAGALKILNSTLDNNTAAAHGGAIFQSTSPLIVRDSTLNSNTAGSSSGGGAVYILDGAHQMSNSTVSGNSAMVGGGVFIQGGQLTLDNSTFSLNTVTDTGGAVALQAGTLLMRGNIMANSINAGSAADDCTNLNGTVTAVSNLVEKGNCIVHGANGNIGLDPGLGLLLDNGGPTRTHGLNAGSPAIDAIPAVATALDGTEAAGVTAVVACVPGDALDQRGYWRANGAGKGGTACDMGAFEYGSARPTAVGLLRFEAAPAAGVPAWLSLLRG